MGCSFELIFKNITLQGYSGNVPPLDTITILGVASRPTKLTLSDELATGHITFDEEARVLKITELNISMIHNFRISWS